MRKSRPSERATGEKLRRKLAAEKKAALQAASPEPAVPELPNAGEMPTRDLKKEQENPGPGSDSTEQTGLDPKNEMTPNDENLSLDDDEPTHEDDELDSFLAQPGAFTMESFTMEDSLKKEKTPRTKTKIPKQLIPKPTAAHTSTQQQTEPEASSIEDTEMTPVPISGRVNAIESAVARSLQSNFVSLFGDHKLYAGIRMDIERQSARYDVWTLDTEQNAPASVQFERHSGRQAIEMACVIVGGKDLEPRMLALLYLAQHSTSDQFAECVRLSVLRAREEILCGSALEKYTRAAEEEK